MSSPQARETTRSLSTVTPIHVVLGTAGHIDHGKTTLVKALTGVDTDRLPEEKKRGITIVLGFAPLDLEDGSRIGVVDVPGHERFVKNMVAGAGGIDLVLLVVAADEGVMPQTREHLEICHLLGIRRGLVALTKVDRATPDLVELAIEDVRAHLSGTALESIPIVPCSAVSGVGLDRLRSAIAEIARGVPKKAGSFTPVLPVDRVFSVKGFGSVVTGTLLEGTIGVGDTVEVLPPMPGRPIEGAARVRSVEVFHEKVERAFAGDRTAISLTGVELDQLSAGQLVLAPGAARPTRLLDVELAYLSSRKKPIKTGAQALLHIGTALLEATVTLLDADKLEPGASGMARLRLRHPAAALAGQRFILRGFDAVEQAGRTIGGGLVLDPEPVRRRRHAESTTAVLSVLKAVAEHGRGVLAPAVSLDAAVAALVAERGPRGIDRAVLARRLGRSSKEIEQSIARAQKAKLVVSVDPLAVDAAAMAALEPRIIGLISAFHAEHPFRAGMAESELASRLGRAIPPEVTRRAANALVGMKKLEMGPEGYRVPGHAPFAAAGGDAKQKIQELLESKKLEPPSVDELEKHSGLGPKALKELLGAMVRAGDVVRASAEIYFGKKAFAEGRERIVAHLLREGEISTATAKTLTGVSRKYLIPFLEALDKAQVTVRVGEVRKAGSRARG